MDVMGIRDMRMSVPLRLVPVRVAMFARRHRIVPVIVMAVIVPVGVLVLQLYDSEAEDRADDRRRTRGLLLAPNLST